MNTRESILEIKRRVSQSIIGQEQVVERLILALLANGNVLMEGLPGLAKTRAIKSLSRVIESDFSRIQFTPDLLPSDVTGTEVYYDEGGKGTFKFQPGPIFGNLILADEINRAPAKVQAALLEAMEERQITVAGTTHKLPALFMVLATQNPIEQEGTYPLPEAQMDRFLLHVMITYPNVEAEAMILRLVRGEEGAAGSGIAQEEAIPQQAIFDARNEIHEIVVADAVENYIVTLINATRHPADYGENLAKWIHVGASPRGSIALDKTSRAHAWLENKDHVTPDNVRAVVHDCLRHRLILSYEANAEGITTDDVIREIVKQVAVA
ncbi:MAG: AAA family ATPase [Planctomycetota bacterium]|jgi:MoxR-like ATPase